MKDPICPNCKEKTFEIQTKEIPYGIEKKKVEVEFIQCSHCGTVIGACQTKIIMNYINNCTLEILRKFPDANKSF